MRERDAVLRQDVVVGDQRHANQPVDVAHEALQALADEAADGVGTPGAGRRAVVVEAGDPRVAGRERLACSAGETPACSSPPKPGKSSRAADVGPLLEPVYDGEPPDEVVEVVIGEAAADLIVRVRQAAVQPQPRRLDRPGGEHDDLRLLGRRPAGAVLRHVIPVACASVGLDADRERVGDQRHGLPARPTSAVSAIGT